MRPFSKWLRALFRKPEEATLEDLARPLQQRGETLQAHTRAFLLEQRARVQANIARGSASGEISYVPKMMGGER